MASEPRRKKRGFRKMIVGVMPIALAPLSDRI